ncbi:MarR family transcriptional regulator [Crocinitomix sp.]|nr:MarR family transcriptional regulator [Crocinitomix sp.]
MDYTDILIPLRKIVRSVHLESKKIQKECGLSIPQLLTLTFLSRCADFESSQLAIRKYLHLNSSTVTGIIARLTDKGLVAKLPSAKDKRETWLSLTAKGLKQLTDSPPLLQEKLATNLAKLSPNEYQTIQDGLTLLMQVMKAENEDPSPISPLES